MLVYGWSRIKYLDVVSQIFGRHVSDATTAQALAAEVTRVMIAVTKLMCKQRLFAHQTVFVARHFGASVATLHTQPTRSSWMVGGVRATKPAFDEGCLVAHSCSGTKGSSSADGVHPNAGGYVKMGQAWYNGWVY
jgi:hypothetical protein